VSRALYQFPLTIVHLNGLHREADDLTQSKPTKINPELPILEKVLFSGIISIYHSQIMASQNRRIETVSSNLSNWSTAPIATNPIARSIPLLPQIIYAQN